MSTTLTEFLDAQCETAKSIFRDRGQVHPMWIIEAKSGECFIVPTSWENDAEKDRVVNTIRSFLKVVDAPRYAFVTEAWILQAVSKKDVNDAYKKYNSLEHHPDRREVLMVTVEDRKEAIMRSFYILRPEHGSPKLSPAEDMTSNKSEGRFANLLPKDA